MALRVLLISNKFPYPTDDGKKAVLAGFVHYLMQRHGKENVAYVVVGQPVGTAGELPCETVWLEPPRALEQAWGVALGLLTSEDKSIQELVTYSPRVGRLLQQEVTRFRPDILLLDTIRIGQYFWDANTAPFRRILFMDDLFYLRFARLLQMSKDGLGGQIKAAGTFRQSLPRVVRAMLESRHLRDFLYRVEMHRVERRELACLRQFDRCLLMNRNEVAQLRARYPEGDVAPVNPYLPDERGSARQIAPGAPTFIMFGSLRHPVYRASVTAFLEQAMPKIRKRFPEANIDIIGGGADEQLQELCRRYTGNVRLRGFVESIDAEFSRATAMLAPLIAAGGLKLKVVTALCHGLPVIATPYAVDGIPLAAGTDYVSVDEFEGFADAMLSIAEPGRNARMSERSRTVFEQHYGKEAVFAAYDKLLGVKQSGEVVQ